MSDIITNLELYTQGIPIIKCKDCGYRKNKRDKISGKLICGCWSDEFDVEVEDEAFCSEGYRGDASY